MKKAWKGGLRFGEAHCPAAIYQIRIRKETVIFSFASAWYAGSTSAPQLSMPPTPRMAPQTVTTVRTGCGSSSRWAAASSCCGV